MKTSTTITKIAPALLLAQKEIGSASKDAVNPFFKSKYADLGAVMEACKEALNKNGILVLQPIGVTPEGITSVETILLHESGEFITDFMIISQSKQNDPQAQGSAITYARRYSLQSMMFIPAEDDDAEKATNKGVVYTPKPTQPETDDDSIPPMSQKQYGLLQGLYKAKHGTEMPLEIKETIKKLNIERASELITKWKAEPVIPERDLNEEDNDAPR